MLADDSMYIWKYSKTNDNYYSFTSSKFNYYLSVQNGELCTSQNLSDNEKFELVDVYV